MSKRFVLGEGRVKFRQGDCLELMKKINGESIDLVVTSPPYDDLRTYNGNIYEWNEKKWKCILRELFRITKPGGVVVWIVGDATIKGSETGTSFKQALYAKKCGFCLHDTMIWNKNNFTAVGALKHRYAPVFEYMFIFSKGTPKTFNPIKDRKNKSFGRKTHGTIRQKDGSTRPISKPGVEIPKFGQRHNIWIQPPEMVRRWKHPAMYPEKLVHDHIISWSNKGDTVFDPFTGSGTTGAVCMKLKRRFMGTELDKKYFRIACERIEETYENR